MIPAFTVSPHVAARLQDEIAAHMLAASRDAKTMPRAWSEPPKGAAAPRVDGKIDKIDGRQVLRMAEAGFSSREICEIIGRDQTRVERAIRRARKEREAQA